MKHNATSNRGTPPKSVPQDNYFLRKGIAEAKQSAKHNPEAFPVWAFPEQIREIIKDYEQNLNAVTDFLGCAMLYTASVAIGNRFRLRVKEDEIQPASLYIAIVGKPNVGKTFPFRISLKPLHFADKELSKQYKEAKKAYMRDLLAYQALSKEEKANPENSEPVPPRFRQLVLQDSTPEATVKALSNNPEGIGLFLDELAAWVNNFNRYHKGSEEQMWLSFWNGGDYKSNRKTSGEIFLDNVFISVGGGIQPETLRQIGKSRTENGFIDRILFAYPSGLEKKERPETDVCPDSPRKWFNVIGKLLAVPVQFADNEQTISEPRLLWLSSAAKEKFREFDRGNVLLCNDPENEAFAGAWGKLDIYVFRIALIMELLQYACSDTDVLPREVSEEAMERAISLCEYFRIQAKRVITLIKDIDPLEGLPANEFELYHALPECAFGIKECQHIAAKFGLVHATSFRRFLMKCVEKGLMSQPKAGKYAKV